VRRASSFDHAFAKCCLKNHRRWQRSNIFAVETDQPSAVLSLVSGPQEHQIIDERIFFVSRRLSDPGGKTRGRIHESSFFMSVFNS
jgi:hypothetical protein